MEKLRVVFWGTPEFAAVCLEKVMAADFCEVVGVITQPDRKVGRKQVVTPPPVKSLAVENGIPVSQPLTVKGNEEILDLLAQWKPDINVVVAYGHILPQEILEIGKYGCVNVHGSLLPKYRGASPVQSAILHGETKTGVTIMKMVEKMDAGDILSVEEVEIGEDETADQLMERLAIVGGDLLVGTLGYLRDERITPLPQDEAQATYCEKIQRTDGEIDWSKSTAKEIYNQLRAFTPWPGVFTDFNGKRLKILRAKWLAKDIVGEELGKLVVYGEDGAAFVTSEGVLLPLEVQLEGKQPMQISDFVRGYLKSE